MDEHSTSLSSMTLSSTDLSLTDLSSTDLSSTDLSVSDVVVDIPGLDSDDEDEETPYDLTPTPGQLTIGLCVVFNFIKFSLFSGLRKRKGSEKDFEKINATFRKFGFHVEEKRDSRDMIGELKKIINEWRTEWKCFACFILSHGRTGDMVFDAQGRRMPVSDLVDLFCVNKCTQLAGKPKLFFIQSCRGKKYQKGVPVEYEEDDIEPETAIPAGEPDFFVSFTTPPGFKSFRSRKDGSVFIQILMQVLQTFGMKDDISAVMRRVTRLAGKMDFRHGAAKICPSTASTLCRPLIFSLCEENMDQLVNRYESIQIAEMP